MSETEVEVEDYEEIVGDLYYDDSVEAVPNADSFQEPTLNQNVSSLTPKNRPILRSSNLSLAGDLQESIPKVVIRVRWSRRRDSSFSESLLSSLFRACPFVLLQEERELDFFVDLLAFPSLSYSELEDHPCSRRSTRTVLLLRFCLLGRCVRSLL